MSYLRLAVVRTVGERAARRRLRACPSLHCRAQRERGRRRSPPRRTGGSGVAARAWVSSSDEPFVDREQQRGLGRLYFSANDALPAGRGARALGPLSTEEGRKRVAKGAPIPGACL